jgi:hypothetical protein
VYKVDTCLGDLGVGGGIIIKMDLKKVGCKDVDWPHLTEYGDQWWTVVNMVMNLWVPQKAGSSLSS